MLRPAAGALAILLAIGLCAAPVPAMAQGRSKRPPPEPKSAPPDYARPDNSIQPQMQAPVVQSPAPFDPAEITKIPSERQKYCRRQYGCPMTGPCPPCNGL